MFADSSRQDGLNSRKEFQPYVSLRLDGCILRGSRVVIPPPGRQLILDDLHDTNTGSTKIKSLARSFVWWPGMDAQIEKLVKSCAVCLESRPSPAPAPRGSRLHIDFAGPFLNHMFMVVVDAHSKWLEASIMSTTTATKTIEQLRIIFATHGLPRKVVTDNGPTFTSEQFRSFMSLNGIIYVTTAPYHPSSNGLAEHAVLTVKLGLKRRAGSSL